MSRLPNHNKKIATQQISCVNNITLVFERKKKHMHTHSHILKIYETGWAVNE